MSILSDPGPEENKSLGETINVGPVTVGDTTPPEPTSADAAQEIAKEEQVETPLATAQDTVTPSTPSQPAPSSTPVAVVNEPPQMSQYDMITEALMKSIGDPGKKANFKMLVHGPPGATKSSFLATAPNNLVIDFEQGAVAMISAAQMRGRPNAEGVQALPYKSNLSVEGPIERMRDKNPAFDKFEVFSIDTFSDYHKRLLQEITERGNAARPSKSRYVPETEDYIEVNEILTRLARSLRDLDRDIIITTHSKTVEPKNKPAKTYPDFSESLANKIEAMMDVVGYMEMRPIQDDSGNTTIVPVMRVISEGTIHCKTRIPLPAEIMNPDWRDIKAVWEQVKAS